MELSSRSRSVALALSSSLAPSLVAVALSVVAAALEVPAVASSLVAAVVLLVAVVAPRSHELSSLTDCVDRVRFFFLLPLVESLATFTVP